MSRPLATANARAFLGRRSGCGAGGHSRFSALAENLEAEEVHDGTSCLVFFEVLRGAENLMGPESTVPGAASGGGGARLCLAGAAAGQGRA